MVDLVTLDSHKGRGLAPLVTRFAAAEFKRDGFRRLHTWVWHSNTPSIRSFQKARWSYTAFLVYLKIRGLPPIYFRRRRSKPISVLSAASGNHSVKIGRNA
jgi:ribosomal protein S18 acetylase RimI-like enzyme